MARRHALLASILAAGLSSAADAADPCATPPAEPSRVTVRALPTTRPPVDRSLTVLELTRRARDLGNVHARRGRVLGLTTAEFRFTVPRLSVESVAAGSHGACLRPAEIAVELEATQKVYVVRAQGALPCWDAAILEHELQHVGFNNEAVARTAELLKPRLDALAEGSGTPGTDAEAAGRALVEAVQRLVREAAREALAEAATRHASIDTPRAYTQVQRRCGL